MKSFARILSIFLSMLMVLYLVPAEVYSLKTSATEPAIDKIVSTDNVLSTEAAEVTALGEDLSKRTASSKTIRMSDGSYRLVQYANEVHYEKGGEWIEYDNSLSLSASENLFTGNLVFVHGDIATNGNILPLAVSHVYNGSQIKQQFTFVEGDIHTADYSNMTVGYGFKLSIQETIIEKSIDGETWYVYNDADGTELYFNRLKDEDGNYISNVYYSEDGLDLTIIKSGGVYTMEDKVGNTKKFVSNGMLTEIADLHGNKKTITYVGGRVSSVTHTPVGGTAKTQLTFTYNSAGALQKITNAEDTGEYVTFSY